MQFTCIVAKGTLCLNIPFKVEVGERIRVELIVEGPFAIPTYLKQNILLLQLPFTITRTE